jgi:putative Ca2+/H+ antiporter (TMEM165/GDT1 family)
MSNFIAEFGDKTFLVAAALAIKYSPLIVFLGCGGALVLMVFISCACGKFILEFVNPIYI